MQELRTRYIVLACVLAAFVPFRHYAARVTAVSPRCVDVSRLPRIIGKWKAVDAPVEQKVRDILETDAVLIRGYADGKGGAVGLALVYYADAERVALHLPESCLMGRGSRLADRKPETIMARGRRGSAMRLMIERGSGKDIIIYYFQTAGFHTASYFDFRIKMLLNRLAGKQTGCALVRFSVSVPPGMTSEHYLALLHEFILSSAGIIDDFLP